MRKACWHVVPDKHYKRLIHCKVKELKRYLRGKSLKQASLTLAPPVIDEILKDKEALRVIEHKYRIKINLISNPTAHLEDIKFA